MLFRSYKNYGVGFVVFEQKINIQGFVVFGALGGFWERGRRNTFRLYMGDALWWWSRGGTSRHGVRRFVPCLFGVLWILEDWETEYIPSVHEGDAL